MPASPSSPSTRGFTLVETLIATGLLVTALAGLAQLFAVSLRFTRDSGQSGAALAAAEDQLEALRALRFGYDEAGAPLTDPRLAPAAVSALSLDTVPWVDWVDERGASAAVPEQAAFVRRWRITPLDGGAPDAIAIEVCVFWTPALARGPVQADACLATVRVRQS